jgi:SAM-dependent methyltransferase
MERAELDIRALYETHARTCDAKDFQSQVMRNPYGKPVGQDQLDLLIDGVVRGLNLERDDILLDLCCGNGAITDPIFARCKGGVGVDFTRYLIEVAKTNFERPVERVYEVFDVQDFVETTNRAECFTKVMCYGAFQCLSEKKAAAVLVALRQRFPNVQRVFLGNLPDLDNADLLFRETLRTELWPFTELKRHDTLFGIWRTREEIIKLALECGWRAELSQMPSSYYCAYYRFDAALSPC